MAKGRPRIEIDQKQFEQFCGFLCTQEEIACFCGCSVDTVERWCKRIYKKTFAEVYKKFSQFGKISLRRAQFRAALDGNVTMLIWLGKQYLGQSEKMDNTRDGDMEALKTLVDAIKGNNAG